MDDPTVKRAKKRRVSRPSPTRDLRIAERYRRGDQIKAIGADERVDVKTVGNVARRLGLPKRRRDQPERAARIAARYAAGEPVHEIADEEGVHRSYVRNVAKRIGLPPRVGWQRLYPINEAAFDHPTSTGWWLVGLLAADGCILENDHRVSLAQKAADEDVLYAFFQYVGAAGRALTDVRLKQHPERRYKEARIWSRRICAALARHGVGPRKSKSLKFSEEAAAQPAVWLGLFDGDGSAGATRNHGIPRIDFYGTAAVMRQCSRFWSRHLTLQTSRPPSLIAHAGGLTKVAICGTNAASAARIMLESSSVSHLRKRRTLEQIASYERAPHWRLTQPKASAIA